VQESGGAPLRSKVSATILAACVVCLLAGVFVGMYFVEERRISDSAHAEADALSDALREARATIAALNASFSGQLAALRRDVGVLRADLGQVNATQSAAVDQLSVNVSALSLGVGGVNDTANVNRAVLVQLRASTSSCNLQCQHGGAPSVDCSACLGCAPGFGGPLCQVPVGCDAALADSCRGEVNSTSCACVCPYGWVGESCGGVDPNVTLAQMEQYIKSLALTAKAATAAAVPRGPAGGAAGAGASAEYVPTSGQGLIAGEFGPQLLSLSYALGNYYVLGQDAVMYLPHELRVRGNPQGLLNPRASSTKTSNVQGFLQSGNGVGGTASYAGAALQASGALGGLAACGDYEAQIDAAEYAFWSETLLANAADGSFHYALSKEFARALAAVWTNPAWIPFVLSQFGDSFVDTATTGGINLALTAQALSGGACGVSAAVCWGGNPAVCPASDAARQAWMATLPSQYAVVRFTAQPLDLLLSNSTQRAQFQAVMAALSQSGPSASACPACANGGSCRAGAQKCTCAGTFGGPTCSGCGPHEFLLNGACVFQTSFSVSTNAGTTTKSLGVPYPQYLCMLTTMSSEMNSDDSSDTTTCQVYASGGVWVVSATANVFTGHDLGVTCTANCARAV
jgi:hypothetical protein